MEPLIEPELDSVAGNIEIAIYMTTEIEDALADICNKKDTRTNMKS